MPIEISSSASRVQAIDWARGAALVGMAVYHLSWDLAYFHLIPADFPVDPPMRLYSHIVAGAFLVLVGISTSLAHSRAINWTGFLRRLAIVGGAAVLVTLATRAFAPNEAIYFGILHCIVVSSVLALPLARAPPWLALAAAGAALAAPMLFAGRGLDGPSLAWLGFGAQMPTTLDWRPLFPWSGLVFLGVGAAGLASRRLHSPPPASSRMSSAAGRALAWTGRHSLAIYLVHQPILLGVLFAATTLTGYADKITTEAFNANCQRECRTGGGSEKLCGEACQCVAKGLRNANLAIAMTSQTLSVAQNETYSRVVRACAAAQ